MNSPDDFNKNINEQEELQAPDEARVSEPEWHSVSYHTEGALSEAKPRKKARNKRVAIMAVALVCAIVIPLLAALGGALMARQILLLREATEQVNGDSLPTDTLFGDDNNTNDSNNTQGNNTGDANNTGNGGDGTLNHDTPYPADTEDYDYAAVFAELQKNNDASLVGSANGSAGNAGMSLIALTAAVKDSVVEITTATVSNRGTIYAGAGSGVIIHEDGLIVTNHHVIADCDEIVVRLTNGETYYATLRGSDESGDIAILKIKPRAESPLTVARLGNSKALALGEEVIAIGNPLGELGGTVTNGIISALERQIRVDGQTMTLLQTNAAINSGNSGGGLFNMAGELIGIVNAKYAASGVEGLGFAIPIDTAYAKSFADLLQHGYIRGIPDLGVTLEEHTGGGFFLVYGAYVADAKEHAQIQTGDYIYSIDGTVVYSISTSAIDAIKQIVRSHAIGDTLTVVVKRGNHNVTLNVTLTEYTPN